MTALRFSGLTLIVASLFAAVSAADAQVSPVDVQVERCKQLLKREIKQLSDEELRALKVCLEPLKRREDEKRESAGERIPRIEQQAPLRVYGK
jgi:hypothetical protein